MVCLLLIQMNWCYDQSLVRLDAGVCVNRIGANGCFMVAYALSVGWSIVIVNMGMSINQAIYDFSLTQYQS